jgi:hypothetical protein
MVTSAPGKRSLISRSISWASMGIGFDLPALCVYGMSLS